MKFLQYINEVRYKPTASEMKQAIKHLSKSEKVKPKDLEYIGSEDYRTNGEGSILIHFNIMNPRHKRYKSTIAYKIDTK